MDAKDLMHHIIDNRSEDYVWLKKRGFSNIRKNLCVTKGARIMVRLNISYRLVNFSTCCSVPLLKLIMYIPLVKWLVLMVAEPCAT